ncbi:MAG: hypothetical protein Q7U57_01125 [Methylovulum sp.]|nr:hypothetical protein [Methylovulum sp.]
MKLNYHIAAATLLAWIVAWHSALAVEPTSQEVLGLYEIVGNTGTTLQVKAENGQLTLELSGGGMASEGAAVSGDCLIVGQGKMEGNRLATTFSAVETDTFSYGSDQAKNEGRKLEIVFEPDNKAKVVRADTLGYCGLATEFTGEYRRKPEK